MILQLSELISRSVEQTLEERIAVSFSGGLDSSVIATIAKKHADAELFTAGTENSVDVICAEKVASELGLPLNRVPIDEKCAMDAYAKCHSILKLDLLKLGILVPVYCVAQAAARKGHSAILFGSGAEELFVGYERYYLYKEEGKDLESLLREEFRTLPQRDIGWIKRVCRSCGLEARFPFYNNDLAEIMFSVPLEERMDNRELKKGVLREAAKVLGAPRTALMRRKKAMQYGSGVHKILMRRAEELNRAYPAPVSRPL